MDQVEQFKPIFVEFVKGLQDQITSELKKIDPCIKLTEEMWEREDFNKNPGGGGRTRAFEGDIIENAGVNFSEIHGAIDPQFAKRLGAEGSRVQGDSSSEIWASGISLIIHPRNPRVPTVHANFRMIQLGEKYWFGGGADLTPFYPHEEDFEHFHQTWSDACAPYNCYESMKKECDQYFVNRHREGEMRGIGGLFYDHFSTNDLDKDFSMVKALGETFIPSYFPIVEKRKDEAFNSEDEEFQLFRRGRYVEFNLLHDRGTLFGLRTNGRTESILISLPARCHFGYREVEKWNKHPLFSKMMTYYRPQNWV